MDREKSWNSPEEGMTGLDRFRNLSGRRLHKKRLREPEEGPRIEEVY